MITPRSVYDNIQNIVEKGENAGYQHFFLLKQCFRKNLSSRVVNPFPNKPWFLRVCI